MCRRATFRIVVLGITLIASPLLATSCTTHEVISVACNNFMTRLAQEIGDHVHEDGGAVVGAGVQAGCDAEQVRAELHTVPTIKLPHFTTTTF